MLAHFSIDKFIRIEKTGRSILNFIKLGRCVLTCVFRGCQFHITFLKIFFNADILVPKFFVIVFLHFNVFHPISNIPCLHEYPVNNLMFIHILLIFQFIWWADYWTFTLRISIVTPSSCNKCTKKILVVNLEFNSYF